MPSLVVQKLNRLPMKRGTVFQGGLFRMPAWVGIEKGPKVLPFRPHLPLWVNVHNRTASRPPRHDDPIELNLGDALQTLVQFCNDKELCGFRPETVEVRQPELEAFLQKKLEGTNIRVVYREVLPAVDHFMHGLAEHMSGHPAIDGPLSENGVTVDAMRSFAEAAAEFFRAAPWRHLSDQDLVHVESPAADPKMNFFTVLGKSGYAFGLGFYDKKSTFDLLQQADHPDLFRTKSLWMMSFAEREEFPIFDDDLWLERQLPVAAENAYPYILRLRHNGIVDRPNLKQLSFIEGLLRSLALTTEEQIDSGRWELSVPTSAGTQNYTLAIPALLDAASKKSAKPAPPAKGRPSHLESQDLFQDLQHMLDGQQFNSVDDINRFMESQVCGKPIPQRTKESDFDKALDLCIQAAKAKGRLRVKLAKQALAIYPDCADAYILMAEDCGTPEEAIDLYNQAMAAAERDIGADTFREQAGHFWLIPETRPYMIALLGRAVLLEGLGRFHEAAADFREILRLNPNDNQGVRDPLVALLLLTGGLDEAQAVLKKFKKSAMAFAHYAQAFLSFLKTGAAPATAKHLKAALKANALVAKLLLQQDPLPPFPEAFSPGTPEEAAMCAALLKPVVDANPTLYTWLFQNTKTS